MNFLSARREISWKNMGKNFFFTFSIFAVVLASQLLYLARYYTGACYNHEDPAHYVGGVTPRCDLFMYLDNNIWNGNPVFNSLPLLFSVTTIYFLVSLFIFSSKGENGARVRRSMWFLFLFITSIMALLGGLIEWSQYKDPCLDNTAWVCLDFGPVFLTSMFYIYIVIPGALIIMLYEWLRDKLR